MKCRICGKPSGEVTVCAACDELYNALSLLPEIAAVRLWPVPHQAVQELIDGNEESEARLRALEAAAELMLKRDALKGEKDG
jgi:hypothetical protein